MVEGIHVIEGVESWNSLDGLSKQDLKIGNYLVAGAWEVFPEGLVKGSLNEEFMTTELHHAAAELQLYEQPIPRRIHEQLQITAERLSVFRSNPENAERVGNVEDFLFSGRAYIEKLNPTTSQFDRESLLCYLCDIYMFRILG